MDAQAVLGGSSGTGETVPVVPRSWGAKSERGQERGSLLSRVSTTQCRSLHVAPVKLSTIVRHQSHMLPSCPRPVRGHVRGPGRVLACVLAVPPAGRVGRWWPGRGANDQCPPARRHMPMAGRHIMSSPQLFSYIGHGGYNTQFRVKSRHATVSHCTGGLRAVGDPGTTDSGSRLTSHDVMLPAARAPSRALCEAILPISQQRAAAQLTRRRGRRRRGEARRAPAC